MSAVFAIKDLILTTKTKWNQGYQIYGAGFDKIERSGFVNSSQTQKWGKHGSHDPQYKLDREDSSSGDVAE